MSNINRRSLGYMIFFVFITMSCFQSISSVYGIIPSSFYLIFNLVFMTLGLFSFIFHLKDIAKKNQKIFIMFFLVIIYILINIIFLDVSFIEVFLFYKDLGFIFFGVWFVYYSHDLEEIKSDIEYLKKLFLYQIPIIFIQFIYYVFFYKGYYPGTIEDNIVGFLGYAKTGEIGVFSAILGILFLKDFLEKPRKSKMILIFILFTIQFIISAKASILFWIFGLIFVSKDLIRKIRFKRFIFVLFTLIILFSLSYILSDGNVLNKKYIIFEKTQLQRFEEGKYVGGLSRTTSFFAITNYLSDNNTDIFLGHGIGSTRSLQVLDVHGRDYYSIEETDRYMKIFNSSFSRLYYEMGLVGALLIMLFLYSFFKGSKDFKNRFIILSSIITVPYINAITSGFLTIYFVLIMAVVLKERGIALTK